MQIEEQYLPLIGEVAWHSINIDPRIDVESRRHYDLVLEVLRNYSQFADQDLHILEIASYAHTTGYRLARALGAKVTLFEISRHSLSLGRNLGRLSDDADNPRLVVGDFHALPFEDASFNFIYICSALHHTWNYQLPLREMARVLAPGGLLFLENEPLRRQFCFYKFRCNRAADFTPFEKKLNEFDMIRTVAEPYVGSRPETLFGMIENQQMPLEDLLGVVQEQCELEAMDLAPELCMGPLEKYLAGQRGLGAEKAASLINAMLAERCGEARKYLSALEQGLGYALPTPREILDMSQTAGAAVAALPADAQTPLFRYHLARLFGSPLRLVARKRPAAVAAGPQAGTVDPAQTGCALQEKAERFHRQYPRSDGIYHCFPESVNRLLNLPSLLPDIQTALPGALQACFPPDQWAVSRGPEGIVAVANRAQAAVIRLPEGEAWPDRVLAVVRIFCSVTAGAFYRLRILCGGQCLFTHGAFQSETVLFARELAASLLRAGQGCLELRLESAAPAPADCAFTVTIPYAGFFPVG